MRDHGKGGALTEVTFFILLALYTPKHGYAIMQFIQTQTAGRLTLGAGTLYGALRTLQEKGWIAPGGPGGQKKSVFDHCSGAGDRGAGKTTAAGAACRGGSHHG